MSAPHAPRAPRNRTKADVRIEDGATGPVLVKDFSERSWLVRALVGRPTLRREARAYARLAGLRGVPRMLGRKGPDAIVIEHVEATSLDRWGPGTQPERVFDELDAILAAIHARGVAIADLHRANVLVSAAGEVHVVDFALARIAREPSRPGPLVRALIALDRHAAARIRAFHFGRDEPTFEGHWGALYRVAKRFKTTARKRRSAT